MTFVGHVPPFLLAVVQHVALLRQLLVHSLYVAVIQTVAVRLLVQWHAHYLALLKLYLVVLRLVAGRSWSLETLSALGGQLYPSRNHNKFNVARPDVNDDQYTVALSAYSTQWYPFVNAALLENARCTYAANLLQAQYTCILTDPAESSHQTLEIQHYLQLYRASSRIVVSLGRIGSGAYVARYQNTSNLHAFVQCARVCHANMWLRPYSMQLCTSMCTALSRSPM
jgi:hypothetical protein